MNKWSIILGLGVLFLGLACREEQSQTEIDREKIEQYLASNNMDAEEHPSGLFYIIHEEGIGSTSPSINATVTVIYKGYQLDGAIFDQTEEGTTSELELNRTIAGWQIGIPLLKKGGRATLLIPSGLAYGPFPPFPNQVLLFDVELVDFTE